MRSTKQQRLDRLTGSSLAVVACCLAQTAAGQTVGPSPPTRTTTINVASGTTTVVGSTIVSTIGTTSASNVTGGTLTFDSTAGPAPGPISVQTVNGNALQAAGGTILVPAAGLTVQTGGGHAALANGATSSITFSNGATINLTGVGAGLAAITGTIQASGVVISGNAASRGHGAVAESGGTVDLHAGTTITTGGGFNAVALGASGAGSRVNADALIPVTTTGRGAMGIYMHDGGLVSLLAGSTLNVNGTSSVGITADNTFVPAGTIGSGLTINLAAAGVPAQAGSTGVVAVNGGNITLNTLTVTGPNAAAGVWAATGSTVSLTGASVININSAQNQTFYTLATANLVTPNGPVGSSFSVTGATPIAGLFTLGGTINSDGTTINVTSGNGATGVEAGAGGVVNMTNNTITTTGPTSFGVRVDNNGQVFGRDSRITTSGGGAALFINSAPGLIDLTNSTVLATGANTAGLATLNFSAAGMNTVNLSGGSLVSQQDTAIAAQGPLNVTTTSGAVVTGGGGFLLQAFDNPAAFQQTVVNLMASSDSRLTGDAAVAPLSIGNISLQTGSRWTGAALPVTHVSVDPTSTWTVTASSTVSQQTTNAGVIELTPPTGDPTQLASYKTLTTQNYVGNGGTLGLNTFLGSDGSPSDRLVINGGNASGNSRLRITNTTGSGALTTGNGILVVQAINGATTSAGAFALGNIVAAGPYDYLLFKGGVAPGNEHDWFLRNVLNCSGANPPIPPCPAPPTPDPPGPTPDPPGPIPLYRAEAALYTKVPLVARQMALFTLGTWHERQGDQILMPGLRFDERAASVSGAGAGGFGNWQVPGSAAWGRVYGQHTDQRWAGPLSPEFSGRMAAAQFGADMVQWESFNEHTDRIGVFYAFANTQGDGRGFIQAVQNTVAGTLSIYTHNPGAYWTHIGPSGWYVDAVLMGTFFDVETRSNRGVSAKLGGDGILASIEAGVPLRLSPHLTIEPQGQMIWQHTRFDDAFDPFTTLKFGLADNLVGRIGLRAEGDVLVSGARIQPFAIANLWHAFSGTDSTLFNDVATLATPFEATALEAGGGVVARLSPNHGIYARGTYTRNVGGNFRETIKGQLGVRISW